MRQFSAHKKNDYFRQTIDGTFIKPSLADISITVHNTDQNQRLGRTCWANIYWQYFEDIDNVTASKLPVQLNKKLFVLDFRICF